MVSSPPHVRAEWRRNGPIRKPNFGFIVNIVCDAPQRYRLDQDSLRTVDTQRAVSMMATRDQKVHTTDLRRTLVRGPHAYRFGSER
jgi:hypothetical protein